jgi:hypothetical protein
MALESQKVKDDEIDVFQQALREKYVIPENATVLPSLADTMNVELLVKDDGTSLVLHDQRLPDYIHWAEYDMDLNTLTFVTWRGAVIGLGMKIQPAFRKYLSLAHEITMQYMQGGHSIGFMDKVPMVVRKIGL